MVLCASRINPRTNRCVLRKGSVGRHIRGRPKDCSSRYNSETRRCIRTKKSDRKKSDRKSDRIKKEVRIRDSRKREVECLHVPKTFEDLVEKCACREKWFKKTKIGSGAFGNVYRVCRHKNCNYVVKIQKNDKFAKNELHAYLQLKHAKVTPKLFAAWTCNQKMYIVLEKLYDCDTFEPRKVQAALKKLYNHGWLHCDLHIGNVMCTKEGKVVMIDYGLAVEKYKGPYKVQPRKTFSTLKQIQNNMMRQLGLEELK